MSRSPSGLSNAVVTVAVAPGILSHEWGHYLACRVLGLDVASTPTVFPLTDDVTFEHEPVACFRQDLLVAVAPFVVNSLLALVAFTIAHWLGAPLGWAFGWLGGTLGVTALPSDADTATLVSGARTVRRRGRPLAYALALPLRAATASVVVGGMLAFVWTVVLFGASVP